MKRHLSLLLVFAVGAAIGILVPTLWARPTAAVAQQPVVLQPARSDANGSEKFAPAVHFVLMPAGASVYIPYVAHP